MWHTIGGGIHENDVTSHRIGYVDVAVFIGRYSGNRLESHCSVQGSRESCKKKLEIPIVLGAGLCLLRRSCFHRGSKFYYALNPSLITLQRRSQFCGAATAQVIHTCARPYMVRQVSVYDSAIINCKFYSAGIHTRIIRHFCGTLSNSHNVFRRQSKSVVSERL